MFSSKEVLKNARLKISIIMIGDHKTETKTKAYLKNKEAVFEEEPIWVPTTLYEEKSGHYLKKSV